MNKFLVGLLFASSVLATNNDSILKIPTLQKNNWEIGGTLGTGYASGGIGFHGQINLSTLYYLIDELAVGLDSTFSYSTGIKHYRLRLGPSLQYNFWQNRHLTTYLKGSLLSDVSNFLSHSELRTDIGLDYFPTSFLSIGHYLRFNKVIGGNEYVGELFGVTFGGKLAFHF